MTAPVPDGVAAVPSGWPPPSRSTVTPPNLQHIGRADLADMARVLLLYEQAVRQRLIGASEAERLTFVALAQHVLQCRSQSEGAGSATSSSRSAFSV